MCGISGAIGHLDHDVDGAIRSAHAHLIHRGPDDEGTYRSHTQDVGPGVFFAHRRLAIIDLSASGRQPMVDATTRNVVCFNGEIYNYRQLRSELTGLGATFRTATDTEVILKAYAEWGEAFVGRLRGMFAFALWDAERQETLLVRDRLGIKPLYHVSLQRSEGDTLLFASEVGGLLASGLAERKLDRSALSSYIWNGFVTGPQTIVEQIKPITAGTLAWVNKQGKLQPSKRYWTLPDCKPEPLGFNKARQALLETVEQHMISDAPLGMFLSGGIDSSAVAALATETATAKVRTFNVSFDEASFDESQWARHVAKNLGTEHHEIRLTQAVFHDQLGEALSCLDQPSFDGLNTYFVSRAARDAGITVALSGAGGDEIYGGYRSFRDLPKAAKYSRHLGCVPDRIKRLLIKAAIRTMSGRSGEIPPQTRWGKLSDVLSTKGDLLELYQIAYSLFTSDLAEQLVTDAVRGATDVHHGLVASQRGELTELLRNAPTLHGISALELSLFVGERLLRDTDMASMRASVEIRVPLLDHVVIETTANVDESRRFQPVGDKQLLRKLALGRLDPEIFNRPKKGFTLPIEVWMRDTLQGEIDSVFANRALCESAGLNHGTVNRLWRAYKSGAPGIYWTRVWAIFALLRWLQTNRVSL